MSNYGPYVKGKQVNANLHDDFDAPSGTDRNTVLAGQQWTDLDEVEIF